MDSREGRLDSEAHSDTIIVASINHKTKEIKLVSVYRDTYLDNTNGEYRKATECYYFGGPARSMNMLNKNLDLDIDKYVTVDFNIVADVVDKIGGVEIDVAEDEVDLINGYQEKVPGDRKRDCAGDRTGASDVKRPAGAVLLRIRYTTGDDYKRTERQRTVINRF